MWRRIYVKLGYTVFELVEPGIFVGMRSPTNAIESFFVGEVMDKGIAENNMINQNGHTIMSGELYLEVCYLQKEAQKKKMWHQLPKKLHCILTHVAEVFITNTGLDADLCMVINEYQSILSASTWFFLLHLVLLWKSE